MSNNMVINVSRYCIIIGKSNISLLVANLGLIIWFMMYIITYCGVVLYNCM